MPRWRLGGGACRGQWAVERLRRSGREEAWGRLSEVAEQRSGQMTVAQTEQESGHGRSRLKLPRSSEPKCTSRSCPQVAALTNERSGRGGRSDGEALRAAHCDVRWHPHPLTSGRSQTVSRALRRAPARSRARGCSRPATISHLRARLSTLPGAAAGCGEGSGSAASSWSDDPSF